METRQQAAPPNACIRASMDHAVQGNATACVSTGPPIKKWRKSLIGRVPFHFSHASTFEMIRLLCRLSLVLVATATQYI